MASRFKKLKDWSKAASIAVEVYRLCSAARLCRDLGLTDPMHRSARRVASNIAEGDERDTDKDGVRFFYTAKGSSGELRPQLKIVIA